MSEANRNSDKAQQELARRRAELVLQVRCGLMTAAQAARQLGVSRKTYYEWEKRALAAMVNALQDRRPGRPKAVVDREKRELRRKLEKAEHRSLLLEQTMRIRELLDVPLEDPGGAERKPEPSGRKKNNKNKKRKGKRR
jgi:transposase